MLLRQTQSPGPAPGPVPGPRWAASRPWHTPPRRLPCPGLDYAQATQQGPKAAWADGVLALQAWATRCLPQRQVQLPPALALAYGNWMDTPLAAKIARQNTVLHTVLHPALHPAPTTAPNTAPHPSPTLASAAQALRAQLRLEGLSHRATGQALALAALTMQRCLGFKPYNTQLLAAWLMLNGHLVEMATGEGKTVAAALAAGVAGLAGTPVHVLTANDYLVQRDCDTMNPYFAALGLRCASVTAAAEPAARAAAWRADVVYSTASQVVFDHLRDRLQDKLDNHQACSAGRSAPLRRAQAMQAASEGACATAAGTPAAPHPAPAAQTLLPGLYFCLLDEADSTLLDEAVVPLIVAAPASAANADAYRRAFGLSCSLQRQRDYTLNASQQRATLTAAGRQRVAAAVAGAADPLHPARRACEWVQAALVARLLLRPGQQYTVQGGAVQLIDELTGRVALGRQWQGALHPMVHIKEGLAPTAPTTTAAQISFQRFFPRYWHLGGMSGTLAEARFELHRVYGSAVQRVPLAKADRRRWLGQTCFAVQAQQWHAVVQAVQHAVALGRPVLVGTDSVASSHQLSALLGAAGVGHQVLNASQSSTEAQCIANAGRSGCVTVATNMAGRGTDIRLDAASRSAGGLHVIATQRNRSRRIDRQLLGRAARHGDPGSAQAILSLEDPLLHRNLPHTLMRWATRLGLGLAQHQHLGAALPSALTKPLFFLTQGLAEWRDRQHRRELRYSDQDSGDALAFSGAQE